MHQKSRYVTRADVGLQMNEPRKLQEKKRRKGKLPHDKIHPGESWLGPDGKLYFQSHSGQVHQEPE